MPQPRVVSVVGPGRSGTTLLGNLLGELPGFFCAGEVRWLWTRGVLGGRYCGCGRPVVRCEVWGAALALLAQRRGRSPAEDAEQVARWQRTLGALRHRRAVIGGRAADPSVARALAAYTALVDEAHLALAEVTGAGTLVDTSKRPQDAAVAESCRGGRHVVVHVVRDPRAVAYSWSRVKVIPGPDGGHDMARRGAARSASRWTENCLGALALRRRVPPARWFSLRYEDFATAPEVATRALLDFLGHPDLPNPVDRDRTVRLSPNHTVAGNPSRFRSGATVIREDVEWRTGLSRRDAAVVVGVTAPLLRRHGYPVADCPRR